MWMFPVEAVRSCVLPSCFSSHRKMCPFHGLLSFMLLLPHFCTSLIFFLVTLSFNMAVKHKTQVLSNILNGKKVVMDLI